MKKRIFSALLAVVMVVLLLPVQAFAATEEIKGAYAGQKFETVIDTVEGAKAYGKSGTIPEGLELYGSWSHSNKSDKDIFQMTLRGTPAKTGTYNFSISYYNNSTDKVLVEKVDYTITVEKPEYAFVYSISLDKWPTKTVYYLGDTIDLTGMKVTATVYDYDEDKDLFVPREKTVDVTDRCWVEPAVFTNDEPQTVTVFFKAPGDVKGNLKTFEADFRVTFKYADPDDVMRIEVYQKPTKLTYTVGETLDTTGMTVRLHKGNGSAEDITEGFKTDVTTLDEVGTKTVTVSYGEGEDLKTATFDVTVNEKVEEPVSSSSSEPEVSSQPESSEPEVPSQPESSEPESESEPEVPSELESESEPEGIDVIGGDVEEPEDDDDKGGIPFWAWIIIALLVILIAAAVALFLIGRKRLED